MAADQRLARWLGLPPLAWFLAFYLAALGALFAAAFWQVDPLSGEIQRHPTLDNFRLLLTDPTFRHVAKRTILLATLVTLTDAALAWPFALYAARYATPSGRAWLLAAIMVPLWCSTLARIYAWRLMLAHDGVINWILRVLHLPDQSIAYTNIAMWLVFAYLWLPFMILPLTAAIERIPRSLVEASSDLGAGAFATWRRVLLPMALPGMVAGSIFTFSLTLGDFLTPLLIGGPGSDFIGNVVYTNVGVANNLPFAAAFAVVPLATMAIYLTAARKLGAFDAL